MFHMYLSTQEGSSAVQNKRRMLHVPMEVGLKRQPGSVCAGPNIWTKTGKEIAHYPDIGKYFSIIIKMSSLYSKLLFLCINYRTRLFEKRTIIKNSSAESFRAADCPVRAGVPVTD